ncbi:MAG: M48 family metallopeptidase [Vicinamibacterales bacterium]
MTRDRQILPFAADAVARTLRQGIAALMAVALATSAPLAETRVSAPKNKYSPQQDVELGRQAAAEVEKQLPLLQNDAVESYLSRVGQGLLRAAPREFDRSEFDYYFKVVNVKDLNAFALPGGPMYVNRGMIEASKNEAELAGVMAHELSHVLLRHGTAQATKAQKYQFGALAGAILGAVVGGTAGRAIAEGSQFGIGTVFLKFSREYERDADLLGAQIMAIAGYNPHELANVFKTLEEKSGGSGPQWLSDHPNPGNRYEYINREADSLPVRGAPPDPDAFDRARDALRRLPPAPSTEEVTRGRTSSGSAPTSRGSISERVDPPSGRYRTFTEGGLFQVSVPANWNELPSGGMVRFAPAGGSGQYRGRDVFTHGIEFGLSRNETHDLRDATEELVADLRKGNASLRPRGGYESVTFAGGEGWQIRLDNQSEVNGRAEVVVVTTGRLRTRELIFAIAVAPEDELPAYGDVFDRVLRSVRQVR